ncbi:MAG: YdbL family protein [Proteobacteria bacterium]|nr:YdbL family protein [Pseudomonadota bacterium]
MKKFNIVLVSTIFLFVTACVTINVYFPAAEAEDAAAKIVNKIIGEDDVSEAELPVNPQSYNFNPFSFLISSAHAEVDINISSPAIVAITNRMKARYDIGLKSYLDSSVIGFSNQGFVEIVDAKVLSLKDRQKVKKLVADDNRDRKALYRELAVANGHADWEEAIQNVFIKTWRDKAHSGWKYQDADGNWQTK